MTGGEPRHGRRNNGLFAAEYVVVGDVDPRVGEHLLDVLGLRGIAAYLQPSADQHPVTRLTTLPGRPTDRLFVDRREVAAAREFFAMVTAEFSDDDPTHEVPSAAALSGDARPPSQLSNEFETAWASIVAGYDTSAEGPASWPASEDVSEAAPARALSLPEETRTVDEPSLLDSLDTFGTGLPEDEDDDEDYHPPPPPPLPRPAGITIIGVLGIIAGLVIIADPALLPVDPESAVMLAGASLIAGVIALIGRLRSGNDDEPEDPDHGARI